MRHLMLAALLPAALHAQAGSDIYLVRLTRSGDSLTLSAPVNATARAGYDNQPAFTPDGRAMLYTSIRDDGQADTYRYELDKGSITRITRTAESEYSPTVMPGGRTFSVVRVERDSTQRLWQFALDGSRPALVLPDVAPVGYHAWGDASTVALFVLGDPPTLRLADTRTGSTETVVQNIGRSLHKVPGQNAVSFLHRQGPEPWIKSIDLSTRTIRLLVRALEGNEFYAWTPDGALLMGQGSKLFRWKQGETAGWREIADLAAGGVRGISRLALSPDGRHLAIVADDGAN